MKNNQLKELELFRDVTASTVDRLWKVGKVMVCPKGTVLIRAKESEKFIYLQLSGKSMVYNLTHHGQRKILFIFGKDEMLNEHVFNNRIASIYCETMDQSEIFSVPSAEFVKAMEEDFSLAKCVLEAQERKMWRLSHQLKNTMSSIYLERKLASKLWKLCRDFGIKNEDGIEIDINMTITFLADMLGVSRETTSRVCSALTEYGLIRVNKKRIIIVDPDRLSVFYRTGKNE
ncbi:MAG: Crp/Fnr family transcriptional regulator [Oliverpabstia sp.]